MKKLTAMFLAILILFTVTVAFADTDIDDYWLATIKTEEATKEYEDAVAIVFGSNSSEYIGAFISGAIAAAFGSNVYTVYLTPPDFVIEPNVLTLMHGDGSVAVVTRGLFFYMKGEITRSQYYELSDLIEGYYGDTVDVEVYKY